MSDYLAYLEREGVEIITTPKLPAYMIVTVGRAELSQWFDGKEREGKVYQVWYLPTQEELDGHEHRMHARWQELRGTFSPIWCLDELGYATVYRTLTDAKKDAEEFVQRVQRGKMRPSVEDL